MNNRLIEYLNEIIDKVYNMGKNRQRCILFIKYYSVFDIESNSIIKMISQKNPDACIKYMEFKKNYMYDAYDPILLWIKELYGELYSDMPLDTLLEKCDVYPIHRGMFKTYFETGVCTREEDIIVTEVKHETRQFITSMINILEYMSSKKRIVFLLSKFHFAQESVCKFLYELILSGRCKNLVIAVDFNELCKVPPYMLTTWNKLLHLAKKEKLFSEWDVSSKVEIFNNDNNDNIFIPKDEDVHKYCVRLFNMKNTLALAQAQYYADCIDYMLEVENEDVDEEFRIYITVIICYIDIYSGNYKNVFQLCEKIRKYPLYAKNTELQYIYNKLLVIAKVYGGQKESTYKNVTRCNELAIRANNKEREFESQVLRCIVELDGWKDVILYEKDMSLPEDFEENAYKYNWRNHLSYIYFFGFAGNINNYVSGNEKFIGCENSPYFKKGMEIANSLKNDEAMLNAWQKNIIISSNLGEFELNQYYYEKSLAILKRYNRVADEAQLYCGVGYYCTVREKYDEAYLYFKKALDIFIKSEEPYLACEVMYNMGINAMAAGDYETVENCIQIVLEILELIHKRRIRVANISKLYGMLTISYIQMGREYPAKLYIDKMKNVLSHLLNSDEPDYNMWEDDLFIYYTSCGMMHSRLNDYEEAEKMFLSAEKIWELRPVNQFYVYGMFVYEAALLYKKLGKNDSYEHILKQGRKFFENSSQLKKLERLNKLLAGETIEEEIKGKTITKEKYIKLMDMVERYSLKMNVSTKEKGMNFFENWVELLNEDNESVEVMIERAMTTMENSYNIDRLIYLEIEDGIPKLKYCDKNLPVSGKQIKGIVSYFKKYRDNIVVNRFENDYDRYDEITEIFGKNDVFSMIGIPITIGDRLSSILIAVRTKHENYTQGIEELGIEELNVLKATFRQLLDAIIREKIKLKLEETSITDLLTGLLNRQGFKQELEALLNSESQNVTILYMDLDNFKYCNDHFGHEIGDVVLIAFSRMLENILGRDSIITRYGGDEFVIVLSGKDVMDGINIAEEIFSEIHDRKGFLKEIEDAYSGEVNIEPTDRVTCSIGIASDICCNYEDISGILAKADEALYKVKRSTKNSYEVWQ